MKTCLTLASLAIALASPAQAEGETRDLKAHEHGVGTLDIAVDGNELEMEFQAPGADIVGFEYEATSAEDRKAIGDAVAMLTQPMELFVLPEAAECSVTQIEAGIETEDDHDDDDHDDEHEEDEHDDEHAEDKHDDDEESSHTEFHGEYSLECAHPEKITKIDFAYFEKFGAAREVEVQIVSSSGAQAFEVERDNPTLSISGLN